MDDAVAVSASAASPLTELTHIALSLEALNCGAVLVSRGGIIAHVNARLCEMVRRRREELVGSALVSLYPSGEGADVVHAMLEKFDHPREREFFLPLPQGKRLPVVLSAGPAGRGSLLREYAVITLIDISRQKHAESQLIEQNHFIVELSDRVIEQAKKLREYADSLENRVKQRTAELHDAHMETMYMLAIASEAKDEDTGNHVRRVRRLCQALAEAIGMAAEEAERIGYSAVLHDVGKIHTPDLVLKKPGPLTLAEQERMREHTLAGERILRPSPYFFQASRIARHHHENWDGTGYPDGLAGDDIPMEARIVHLADVFDALTHARVYKAAWSASEAAREIIGQRGRMFDPAVVDAFSRLIKNGTVNLLTAGAEECSIADITYRLADAMVDDAEAVEENADVEAAAPAARVPADAIAAPGALSSRP
jgi:PAS domain S-box-containing protein